MVYWTDEETFKLIEMWGEDSIQSQLESCKRNKDVYMKISRKLNEAGYQKSSDQCRGKARKLKNTYRKSKTSMARLGNGEQSGL